MKKNGIEISPLDHFSPDLFKEKGRERGRRWRRETRENLLLSRSFFSSAENLYEVGECQLHSRASIRDTSGARTQQLFPGVWGGERFAIVYRRRPGIGGGCFIAWPKDLGSTVEHVSLSGSWNVEGSWDCLPRPCLARVDDKLSYKLSRDGDEDALRRGRWMILNWRENRFLSSKKEEGEMKTAMGLFSPFLFSNRSWNGLRKASFSLFFFRNGTTIRLSRGCIDFEDSVGERGFEKSRVGLEFKFLVAGKRIIREMACFFFLREKLVWKTSFSQFHVRLWKISILDDSRRSYYRRIWKIENFVLNLNFAERRMGYLFVYNKREIKNVHVGVI